MITLKNKPTAGQTAFASVSALCLFLVLYYSDIAIDYMTAGLTLCAKTVIPSLFPFMVISELIVSGGLCTGLGKFLKTPCRLLFGTSGASSGAIILGALCGFPIGAKTTVSLYKGRYIDKKEAEHLLSFCNNPSSAFMISAVGASLYGNRRIGVILYSVTLLNSFLCGIVSKRKSAPPTSEEPPMHSIPGIRSFTDAISGAASGMLTVCAYVTFFSAITGCLGHMLAQFGVGKPICALIYGLTELSGGVSTSAALGNSVPAICLTAFIVGWSGLSVHFQIMSICAGTRLSFKKYFLSKAVQGFLNATEIAIIGKVSPHIFDAPTDSAALPTVLKIPGTTQNIIKAVFIISVAVFFAKKVEKAHKSGCQNIY